MGLLNWFGLEKRANEVKTTDPYLGEFFGQRSGITGNVDLNRASGIAVAQSCIATISQALASIPLNLYVRDKNGGRNKQVDHPLYEVLHDKANQSQTAFEVREFLAASLMTNGNAFALLEWNGRGQVTAMYPLNPSSVSVERLQDRKIRYKVTDSNGGIQKYTNGEILHLRYRLANDGIMGLSPIQLARETINLALSQNDTARSMTEKSFRPSGAFVFPDALTDEQYERAKRAFGNQGGANSAGKILVLDGDVKFQPFSIAAKDAEFLESRKLSNLDVCRIWSVPPTVVGILDNGTYSNVEMESRALVTRCLAPMAKRVEQAMNASLLPTITRKTHFIEHDLAGLLRGDLKARYEAYRIGREWGWLSPNEIRGLENLPEIENGGEYLSPLNMAVLADRNNGKK